MATITFTTAETDLPDDITITAHWLRDNAFQCTDGSHLMYPCTDRAACAAGHIKLMATGGIPEVKP